MYTLLRDEPEPQPTSLRVLPTGVPFGGAIAAPVLEDEFTDERFRQPIPLIAELAAELRKRAR